MTLERSSFLLAAGFLFHLTMAVGVAQAMCGDTDLDEEITTNDALLTLRCAVGVDECRSCLADVDSGGRVTAADALRVLKKAVGVDVALVCRDCGLVDPGCTSVELVTLAETDMDIGFTGVLHRTSRGNEAVAGGRTTLRVLERCSDSGAVCTTDADCAGGQCHPTCDCAADAECELAGPTHETRCAQTLNKCGTNADCPALDRCAHLFWAPWPIAADGVPTCLLTAFAGNVSGTVDFASGSSVLSLALESYVMLGERLDRPCPSCGAPEFNPQVGGQFNCVGGQNVGAPCTVHAVSPAFGGVSFDCPPTGGAAITRGPHPLSIGVVTTATVRKQAVLPCSDLVLQSHPSLGNGWCIDDFAPCDSNADCRRCTGDLGVHCATSADCPSGVCGTAPDIPITCGYYCHCGFCDDDPAFPCFDDGDCPDGLSCVAGTGSELDNRGQVAPNGCRNDAFICGPEESEVCGNDLRGTCSEKYWVSCDGPGDPVCADNDAGECVLEFLPCFGGVIERSGTPSPLGRHCMSDWNTRDCSTNADCGGADVCVDSSARLALAGLFCMADTASMAVNNGYGLTGPGSIVWDVLAKVCWCGDGEVGCDESCDDGNRDSGDGCDVDCQVE